MAQWLREDSGPTWAVVVLDVENVLDVKRLLILEQKSEATLRMILRAELGCWNMEMELQS